MKVKTFLFTGLLSGYSPVAPGTAGTLLGMAIWVAEYLVFGRYSWIVNAAAVLVLIYPSIRLCDEGERFFGTKDPNQVVIDEILGYWVAVMFHPFSWEVALAAFFLFRMADIIKPFPAKRLENLKGGMGIMVDDLIAGLYTNGVLMLLTGLSRYYNIGF